MPRTLERAAGASLREICPDARIFGGDDVRVMACCSDSRRCQPGDLYVAITEADSDGHDYDAFTTAIERGAVAIVSESYLPVRVPVAVVDDSRAAYGRICQRLVGNPSESLSLVGVTGTNGKTTTSMLVASILRAAGMSTGFTTSIVNSDATKAAPATRTTPAAAEMANWLMRMANNGCTHGVVEFSSRALAENRTAGLGLDAAVITNIRRDHVDRHGSLQNYREIKERLLSHLRESGFAVLNADDPGCKQLLPKLNGPVVTFGMNEPAEVTVRVLERCPSEQTFLLMAGNEAIPVRTRIIGDQHVMNCLAAATVGLVYGADLAVIARGLEAIERVPHRLDRIECGQSFSVFVDCADTPERLMGALQTLRSVTRGRVHCVFGIDDAVPDEYRPLLGRAVERYADIGILTDGPHGNAEPLQIAHDLIDGYNRAEKAHVIRSRTRAIHCALREARAGDAVLIAGADRRGVNVSDKRAYHGDSAIARDWLYKSAKNDGLKVFHEARKG